jgi:predicted nucleotidyltransferase
MVAMTEIKRAAKQLGDKARAERVILFGSYARGQAGDHSDVDLLIIAESALPRPLRSRELYGLFRPYPFSMDLLVYTPQEVKRGRRSSLSFISTVLRDGKTLYVRGPRTRQAVARKSQE